MPVSNIIGLGFDATDIERIADTLERYSDRSLHRIFTDGEVAYCTRRRVPAIHLAARFAAKEAAMKALGTGHSRGVLWRDIEVVRHGGPPQLQFHGGAGAALRGDRRAFVAVDHHAFGQARAGPGPDPRRLSPLVRPFSDLPAATGGVIPGRRRAADPARPQRARLTLAFIGLL